MQQDLLPLFPLRMVLLPGAPVSLHIFEERYKEMIGQAIERKSEFGIVLAHEKGIVNTGCTAIVREVTHKYDDGRMDIEAVGRRRFEILFLNEEKAYLQGKVEFFEDDDDQPPPQDLLARITADYERLRGPGDEPDFGADPKLSFRVARMVEDIDLQQNMLGLRSESARLKLLADFLPAYVSRLIEVGRMRELARGNGHNRRQALPE
jgi:ATP-dependent protease La (LON) substrate-binding domain